MATKTAKREITTVQMHLDKETQRTYRFAADDEDAAVTQVYVSKELFDSEPTAITLTLS